MMQTQDKVAPVFRAHSLEAFDSSAATQPVIQPLYRNETSAPRLTNSHSWPLVAPTLELEFRAAQEATITRKTATATVISITEAKPKRFPEF